jgi:hypothetical protein
VVVEPVDIRAKAAQEDRAAQIQLGLAALHHPTVAVRVAVVQDLEILFLMW